MTTYEVIQTEKAYQAQLTNTYVVVFKDATFTPNKIEVTKLFQKEGFHPTAVRIVNPRGKVKMRGNTRRKYTQRRPKKYYITLPDGEKLLNPDDNTNLPS